MVSAYLSGRDHHYRQGSMRQRSSYPKPFKAQVDQECLQPGAIVSSVAISHGMNANVILKWLPFYRDKPVTWLPAFVPLKAAPKRPSEIGPLLLQQWMPA
jgi:transposase-like protein